MSAISSWRIALLLSVFARLRRTSPIRSAVGDFGGVLRPMSRRDWLYHVAVRGCLIAALSVPLSGLAQEDEPQDQREAGQSRDAKEQANPSHFGSISRIEREEKKKEPDWNSPKCDQPQTHDEADLCEQRRMSKAAEDALVLSEIQTGLGIAGAALLFITLIATIIATWKAAVAANAAVYQVRIRTPNRTGNEGVGGLFWAAWPHPLYPMNCGIR
jgi:hypothetical protein